MTGPIIPDSIPAVFVIPISTPANLGAISRWLIKYPPIATPPPKPAPIDIKTIESIRVLPKYPQRIRKDADNEKAEKRTQRVSGKW